MTVSSCVQRKPVTVCLYIVLPKHMACFRTLKGLVALVTGGASGLGRATAERFVRQGASVVICDLPTSKGQEVANEIGEQCLYIPANVGSENDVKKMLDEVDAKFKKLHVAVNCAGISIAFKLYNFIYDKPHNLEDMAKVIQTNLIGSNNVLKSSAELMTKNEPDEDGQKGVIINTSSTSAFEGLLGQTAYSASSRGIVSMTAPWANELASHGIRCCTIAPGYFDTPVLGTLPPDLCKFIAENTPFPKRFGNPDEFAHMVQTIVEIPYFNGEVVRLDGGCRMSI